MLHLIEKYANDMAIFVEITFDDSAKDRVRTRTQHERVIVSYLRVLSKHQSLHVEVLQQHFCGDVLSLSVPCLE